MHSEHVSVFLVIQNTPFIITRSVSIIPMMVINTSGCQSCSQKPIITESINKFSSYLLRVFMTTIHNENETKTEASGSVSLFLAAALVVKFPIHFIPSELAFCTLSFFRIVHYEQRLKSLFYKKRFPERMGELKPRVQGM